MFWVISIFILTKIIAEHPEQFLRIIHLGCHIHFFALRHASLMKHKFNCAKVGLFVWELEDRCDKGPKTNNKRTEYSNSKCQRWFSYAHGRPSMQIQPIG